MDEGTIYLSDKDAYRYARRKLGFGTYWRCRIADMLINRFMNREFETMHKNANRYEWLRRQPINAPDFTHGVHVVDAESGKCVNAEHLDALIDRSMLKTPNDKLTSGPHGPQRI